jgi:hypothetical protein
MNIKGLAYLQELDVRSCNNLASDCCSFQQRSSFPAQADHFRHTRQAARRRNCSAPPVAADSFIKGLAAVWLRGDRTLLVATTPQRIPDGLTALCSVWTCPVVILYAPFAPGSRDRT